MSGSASKDFVNGSICKLKCWLDKINSHKSVRFRANQLLLEDMKLKAHVHLCGEDVVGHVDCDTEALTNRNGLRRHHLEVKMKVGYSRNESKLIRSQLSDEPRDSNVLVQCG